MTVLNTITELRRSAGLIEIYTSYLDRGKNLLFFIASSDSILNNIVINQGDLVYTNSNWDNTYFILNENGDLIVVSDEPEKFSINDEGELEYIDMGETLNLGQVSAFKAGTIPPTNTSLIWYDTNNGVNVHKYWDMQTSNWIPFTTNVESEVMYRQDIAAVSGITVISFRSELPSTDYAVEILSFISSTGVSVMSGWSISNQTMDGFTITPPERHENATIVYRASLFV